MLRCWVLRTIAAASFFDLGSNYHVSRKAVSRIDSSARNDSTALLFVMIGWISVELWPVCCVFGIRTVSGGDIMVDGHQK